MLYLMPDALMSTPIDPIETFSTNELVTEISKRFEGFILAGYTLPRCRGEYPPQVYADTDLDTLAEIQELGGKFFDFMASELSE